MSDGVHDGILFAAGLLVSAAVLAHAVSIAVAVVYVGVMLMFIVLLAEVEVKSGP